VRGVVRRARKIAVKSPTHEPGVMGHPEFILGFIIRATRPTREGHPRSTLGFIVRATRPFRSQLTTEAGPFFFSSSS
jgi:hypothetical protein